MLKTRHKPKQKRKALDPNNKPCPACRKRRILAIMEPMTIHGQLNAIKWKCPVCYRAYDAKLKERGTIKPWAKD